MYQLCSCLSITGVRHRCHVLSSLTAVQSSSHPQHCVSTATLGDMASHRSYLRLLETHLRKKIANIWPLTSLVWSRHTEMTGFGPDNANASKMFGGQASPDSLRVNWDLYSCTDASGNLYLFMAWNIHGRCRRGYGNIFYQRWISCS